MKTVDATFQVRQVQGLGSAPGCCSWATSSSPSLWLLGFLHLHTPAKHWPVSPTAGPAQQQSLHELES